MLTCINASQDQIDKMYSKHISRKVFGLTYSYDQDDNIGFVSCYTIVGHFLEFQFRNQKPCFMSLRMSGSSIRYDIHYPEGDMYTRLKELGLKAETDFWKGGQI